MNPITGIVGCCARATSGHATAEPPTNKMKSRRLMCPQIEGPNLPYCRGAETALCNTAKSSGRGRLGQNENPHFWANPPFLGLCQLPPAADISGPRQGGAGKSRWRWNSRVKGLPQIGFSGERIHAVEFGDWIELPFPSRTVEWLITTRPCTASKVRAASTSLPTLFPSSTGSRLSPSSSHQEPSMTWLRPVDRTSGTLTLSAGTLSCLAHHRTPLRSVAPQRPRWNTR